MVLSKDELIAVLRDEVRILQHLASKVAPHQVHFRPTRSQRSIIELLQYMAIMGPAQIASIKGGVFRRDVLAAIWEPLEEAAAGMTFEQAVAAIGRQSEEYARELEAWTDADFRASVDMFGEQATRGVLLIKLVVNGHAAYRTQLFCYLKLCGCDALNTSNLWGGADGPA